MTNSQLRRKGAGRLAALTIAAATLLSGAVVPTALAEEVQSNQAVTQAIQQQIAQRAVAQREAEPQLLASFDFNEAATDGAFVDATTKAKATVAGTANLVDGKDAEAGKAAQMGSGFFLSNITKADGTTALLKGLTDLTISYDSKTTATGGQWTVFAAPNANQVNGDAPTYLGVLDRSDKTRVERYLNGRLSDESTIDTKDGLTKDWKHVDLVISGATAKLYIDQKLVATNSKGKTLTEILGGSGGVLQIGKGNWGNGEYFTGQLDNLKIYGAALSSSQLGVAQPTAITIAGDNVKDGALSVKEGSSAQLSATMTPDDADNSVVWSSSNEAVATVNASGNLTAKKVGAATITATSEGAPTVKGTLKLTVTEVKADDAYGYAMVHFIENSKGYAEKVYLDISQGDNPQRWDTLNGGEPILTSNESTTGVRDPFIAKNPDTGKFYILATDLRVFGGDNAGWGTWSTGYSTKLHVWESDDLVHFSKMKTLETATEDSYTPLKDVKKTQTLTDTVNNETISEIGMAWAPEATWVPNFYDLNDDGKLNGSDKNNPKNQQGGAFVMYWSTSAKYSGQSASGPDKKVTHVLWAATKDFSNDSYMFGGVLVPNSKYRSGNTIDTTLLQRKLDDGTQRTYRTTGSGTIFTEYTDQAAWWRVPDDKQNVTDPAEGWVLRQNNVGHSLGSAQEGANGFKINGENKWMMFVDNYGSVNSGARYGYNPLVATDLDSENPWQVMNTSNFFLTANTKHGGIVSLTKEQYDAIRAADAKASDNAGLTIDDVKVDKGSKADDITAQLPKTQKVTLANGQGTANRKVTWDVSSVDTAKSGEYTVTGTVDTIGANNNHWKWSNASGETKTDLDELQNTTAGANNNWKQSGGMDVTAADSAAKRPLYSSTAITVTAKVVVGEGSQPVEPIDKDVLADFTFDADPTDGTFHDANGTAKATVQGTAKLVNGKDDKAGKAASLGSGFWLNVTKEDGSPLLAGQNDVTISYDSKPAASNNKGWTVFAAENATKQEYAQEHYLGVMDKTDSVTVERYDNAGSRDSSGNLSHKASNAGWKHVDIVISGKTARLYVDQKLVAANNTGKTLAEILGENGGILQIGKANWANGEYFTGQLDNLKIWSKALTADELGIQGAKTDYAAALAIPARITGDLPSTVLGKTVTWTAEGDGAKLVAADGKVTLPAAGEKSVKVKLTATIDGVETPVTAESEILDNGGQIASYVKEVDRSDQNGTKYDPLAYNDDRRADSLYVADKAADANGWTTLNRNHSILSVKWDGSQSSNPNSQMGSPTFFRGKAGKLGAVASQNNATGVVYVWDGTGDGATFANQRKLTLSSASIVTNPSIVYDAASRSYKVFFTDGLSGEGRVVTLDNLGSDAKAGEEMKADVRAMGVQGEGLPAWAKQDEASAFTVSKAEFDKFHNNYVDLQNTGISVKDQNVKNGASADDIKSQLNKTQATATYNDGSSKNFNVEWNADDLAKVDTSKAGTYEVKGTVKQVDEAMYNDARADPDIFYNEDDGYYYLTGSTYEVKSTDSTTLQKDSYRSIGLKRAKTISELKDAKESIIIKPENGTPGHKDKYPNSFYGWSAFIWAQEFHKINGKWWIVAGFHKGDSSANGGWCNNTILIPYTGDTQSIKDGGMLKAENWGEPTVLEGAAFDVTYMERKENGKTQGYWLFPKSAGLYVAKAKMGDGVVPLVDGGLQQIYQSSQVFENGKYAPTPGDNSEGSDQAIVEAPFMFEHGDYIYILYAGGTVDKYYTTNLLRADKDADLQKADSWTQVDFPILDTNDTADGKYGADESSYERKQAGPGHVSLVHDQDGNMVIAYHARPYPEIHSGSAAGGLFDQDRNTWVKAVNVRANGMIDASLTKDQEVTPTNRTVTVKVTVAETPKPETVPVTGVTLDKTSLELIAGDSATLTATVAPEKATNKNVTWTSSDTLVATVDASGRVVAVKAGSAVITVITKDGGFTATAKVTVKDKDSGEPVNPGPGETTKPTSPTTPDGSDDQGNGSDADADKSGDADKSDDADGKHLLSKTGVSVWSMALAALVLAGVGTGFAAKRRMDKEA